VRRAIAAKHKLPAVYSSNNFVSAGGLISYGPDQRAQYGAAAHYIDRILKGERPADLPVQAPTKYQLSVNVKTAKALGIEIPPSLPARADEVIEQRGDVAYWHKCEVTRLFQYVRFAPRTGPGSSTLLLRKSAMFGRIWGPARFALLGGQVDAGETIEEAALPELSEELGIVERIFRIRLRAPAP
jgi:hypothetical protein